MLKSRAHSHHIPFVILLGAVVLLYSCGGGGGGGTSSTVPNERESDSTALADTPLTRGGSTRLKNGNDDEDGASLIVPPGAVDQDADISISVKSTLPGDSPWGQSPVGALFELGPTGLSFDADNMASLTLPIPPGGVNSDLHIGRWNETTGSWEDVGGTITGDFISTELDHLSLYGIFSQGKSLVRILNDVAPGEDPSDLGIEVRYISGPMPPPDWPEDQYFPAYRPLPQGGIDLKIGESRLMALPPGLYHFAVSFPPPYQIANSMYVRIPALETGADDGTVDQTITITGDDASSDDTVTNASLADFPGSWTVVGANEPPEISCSAIVPAGVAVTNNDPDTTGLPSRRVGVGPITAQALNSTAVELTGAATDPEDSAIDYFWTWTRGTLPTIDAAVSGVEVNRYFRPNPRREGRYDVYLTAYDQFHLFDECHWEITVRGNEKPVIGVIADDYVVDYGRFGPDRFESVSAMDRSDLGTPPDGATSWCDYVDTNADAGADTTLLKTLPILPPSEAPDHILRPTQYPPGMTCVYAMVGDADGDPLAVSFRSPRNGDIYDALTGAKITTGEQLDAYNAALSAMVTSFPLPDILAPPLAPQGALYALPIIWEAPDNMVLDLFSSMATHDCRHLDKDSGFDVGPCVDFPGMYPDGGITTIVATVTDGLSREQIDDFGVGYGEDDIVRQDDSGGGGGGGGSGGNHPPVCSSNEFTIDMGSTLADPMSGTDVDLGDTLSFIVTSVPGDGGVNVDDNTYVPDGNYFGPDSFDYVVSDGQAQSETCTVTITINEVRKWYVFKLSGTGYNKRWGGYAEKADGYEYDAYLLYQSELDGIVGTGFDNTDACAAGPWAGPVLTPSIWVTRNMALHAGPFDTTQEIDPYRCTVPNWVYSNPICNGWNIDSDPKYWADINSICGL